MADKKITELTNITGANLVDADEFVVVDISADETKAITLGELKEAFDSGSGFVRITGDTMTGDLALSGADVTFGDNDKATFGAGSDLQIYHDGSNSYIKDAGTGVFLILGDSDIWLQNSTGTASYARFTNGGAATLYYDNAAKLATTSTGVDITGTLTSDGLIFDAADFVNITAKESLAITIDSDNNQASRNFSIYNDGTSQALFRAFDTGDISFYEDTGTTPKFFWDASAESLGIGTSSPSSYWANADDLVVATSGNTGISVVSGTTSLGYLIFADSTAGGDNTRGGLGYDHSTNNMLFRVNNDTKMTIDSSGNVGIGTSSPNNLLTLNSNTANTAMTIQSSDSGGAAVVFGDQSDFSRGRDDSMSFETNNLSEAMRIDSSGNNEFANSGLRCSQG